MCGSIFCVWLPGCTKPFMNLLFKASCRWPGFCCVIWWFALCLTFLRLQICNNFCENKHSVIYRVIVWYDLSPAFSMTWQASERMHFICNVNSHWLKPGWTIDRKFKWLKKNWHSLSSEAANTNYSKRISVNHCDWIGPLFKGPEVTGCTLMRASAIDMTWRRQLWRVWEYCRVSISCSGLHHARPETRNAQRISCRHVVLWNHGFVLLLCCTVDDLVQHCSISIDSTL